METIERDSIANLVSELDARIGYVLERAKDYSKNGVDFSNLMFSTESSDRYGPQVRLKVWYRQPGILGQSRLGKDYSANDYGIEGAEVLEKEISDYLEEKGLVNFSQPSPSP